MKEFYVETIGLVERLHRRSLDVIKAEIDSLGLRDLNAAQALILYNIGERELAMGELIERGYYLGSNVSYNVKKMVENEYAVQTPAPHDKRSLHVKCTEQGLQICHRLEELFERHSEQLSKGLIDEGQMEEANEILRRLEGFWSSARHSGPRR